MSSYKTTISQDVLECNVCYQIPSKDSLRLCVNNHITCKNCIKKSNLVNCQLCNQGFSIARNQLLEQILDSVRNEPRIVLGVNCTFKPAGCEELVTKSNLKEHELHCQFRKVDCFNYNCQADKTQTSLSSLEQHYRSFHTNSTIKRVDVANPDELELSLNSIQFVYHNQKLLHIFVPHFRITEFPQCSVKTGLVSVEDPYEARKTKYNLKIICKGAEVVTHVGMVFSIDDTKDIHDWNSGGLILPNAIFNKLTGSDSKVKISIKREQ